MNVLAIESSCDETAVAILTDTNRVLASEVYSQVALHRPFGGVVPELAARSHVERLAPLVDAALATAGLDLSAIDAVAAARGPGLLGPLLVGMTYGQGLALARGLPFVGVNHLAGHLLSPDLDAPLRFPALVLLATGGHTALYRLDGETEVLLLRRTVDDAVGEAFDKVAKMLNLGYPGGPVVERAAAGGDPTVVPLPRPFPKDPRALSLSGLKTAVRRTIETATNATDPRFVADLCASFQAAVADVLSEALSTALAHHSDVRAVYLVGGVAANRSIGAQLGATVGEREFRAPSMRWCGDNAAMIARAAWPRLVAGAADPWDLQPRVRWEVAPWA